uniref:F-box family protein n=1 Tax=Pithovirus LCPAC401 TaxID=2506595 RepID=A0A481Z9M9_9VIRU|nr:MAG: F-box family protein [Pithovirus LCPAC401]
MASVSEILTKVRLNLQDLNNVSLAQLETVFLDLTVKEISLLCAVNKRFNTVCENESFWKNKVLNDYGIHKKHGNTWRQTSINMSKVNMINLDTKWIDRRTYREIFDDALQQGSTEFIINLQRRYLLPYANNFADRAYNLLYQYENDDTQLQGFANEVLGRDYTENELNDIFYIKNREIRVIHTSVLTYRGGGNLYLPGDTDTSQNIGTTLQSYEFLREMIDPMIYVMQFSSFSHDKLNTVSY